MDSKGVSKLNLERQRQWFSAEFKREAVRLLELGQKLGAGETAPHPPHKKIARRSGPFSF